MQMTGLDIYLNLKVLQDEYKELCRAVRLLDDCSENVLAAKVLMDKACEEKQKELEALKMVEYVVFEPLSIDEKGDIKHGNHSE